MYVCAIYIYIYIYIYVCVYFEYIRAYTHMDIVTHTH